MFRITLISWHRGLDFCLNDSSLIDQDHCTEMALSMCLFKGKSSLTMFQCLVKPVCTLLLPHYMYFFFHWFAINHRPLATLPESTHRHCSSACGHFTFVLWGLWYHSYIARQLWCLSLRQLVWPTSVCVSQLHGRSKVPKKRIIPWTAAAWAWVWRGGIQDCVSNGIVEDNVSTVLHAYTCFVVTGLIVKIATREMCIRQTTAL